MRRALSVAALAVFAAAVTSLRLHAQGPPVVGDSVRDTLSVPPVVRDSVKPPFPAFNVAEASTHGRVWRWEGDDIFQTGALSLAEILARIPGVRVLQTGHILAPHVVTWLGDPGRVRLFVDGVELDVLDSRAGSVRNLGSVPLWHLQEIVVEASPGELRVHLTTWRVERTRAATRVDVLTGDAETNLYRAYFGRRFQSGLGVQAGFQQMGTTTRDRGGDGDGLSLYARVGVARERWTIDVVTTRERITRNATLRADEPGSVPPFTGGHSETYLRFALGSPERDGAWAQLIATALSFDEATPRTTLGAPFGVVPADSVDSTAFRAEYVAAGGLRRGALQATGLARYRRASGEGLVSPAVRLEWNHDRLSLNAFGERAGHDSTMRTDVALRVWPLRWLGVSAAASRRSPIDDNPLPASTILRAEGELSLRGARLAMGVVTRDSARTPPIPIFASGIRSAVSSEATGLTYGIDIPLYKELRAEVHGTRWESMDIYRPVDDVHASIGIETDWRTRFPRGDFSLRAYGMMHNFSRMLIPVGEDATVRMGGARVYSTLLEVRIKTAIITWQFRNVAGVRYETVPGYQMPRIVNLYGVRWRFSN